MREIKISIYNFEELSEEAQAAALQGIKDGIDYSDEIVEHLSAEMIGHGLGELSINEEYLIINSKEGHEDNIYFEGDLLQFVKDKSGMNAQMRNAIELVSSASVAVDDVADADDFNDNGLQLTFSEDAEEGSVSEEAQEELEEEINKDLAKIRVKLIASAKEFLNTKNADAEAAEIAKESEFFEDGSLFEVE